MRRDGRNFGFARLSKALNEKVGLNLIINGQFNILLDFWGNWGLIEIAWHPVDRNFNV